MTSKVLTLESLPNRVRGVEYAVRGPLVTKALEYDKLIQNETNHNLPFSRVTFCNIGNPQQLGQKPLTFIRQVLSLVEYPELMDNEGARKMYPSDVIARAKKILARVGSTGAYSESQGREVVREDVATFICERDGYPNDNKYSSPSNIFVHDGASPAVQNTLRLLIRDEKDGILIPIPQYPLYSAAIPLLGGSLLPYYLDEQANWGLNIHELTKAVQNGKEKGIIPRAIVVINPGNPTGSCLDLVNMQNIVKFCIEQKIVLLADEVYQENIYNKQKPFHSFKKIVTQMQPPFNSLELFSFHSTSKGFTGECGHRGGYVEMTNIDEKVRQEYIKIISINLCSNLAGQIVLSLMVRPPKPGEESEPLYVKERDAILESLKRRAQLVVSALNGMEGITCNSVEGALYAFPKINLPKKAVEAAQKLNVAPDALFCKELLDGTGLCVVPGSGFGNKEGEHHFRTTILPQEDHLREVLQKFAEFHKSFLVKYS